MGQEFSKIKFQRQISECVSLNQLLRHIYRGVSIHVIETVDSIESVRFLLLSRYEIFSEKFDDDGSPIVTKEMDMEQFRLFKRYIIELNKLLNLGATLNPNSQSNIDRNSLSEECPICMEVSVEVALPCTHSFCNKCYEVSFEFASHLVFIRIGNPTIQLVHFVELISFHHS